MWSVTTVRWVPCTVHTHTHTQSESERSATRPIWLESVQLRSVRFSFSGRSESDTLTRTSDRAPTHPLQTRRHNEPAESWDETRLYCSGESESPLQSVVEWMRHTHTENTLRKHTQTDTNPRLPLNIVTHSRSTFQRRALNSAGDVFCSMQPCEIAVVLSLRSVGCLEFPH